MKMRNPLLILAFLIAGSITMNGASVEARLLSVEKVELYPSGGKIFRSIELEAGEGNGVREVTVQGLPGEMSADQIQVKPPEGERLKVANVQFRRLPEHEFSKTSRVLRWERELERIDQTTTKISNARSIWDLKLEQKASLKKALLKGLEESPTEEIQSMLTPVFESERELRQEFQELSRDWEGQIKELEEERKRAEKALQEARQQMRGLSGELKFALLGTFTDSLKIELRYFVSDTSWRPVYRLRADPDNEQVAIEYLADIRNQTWESWDQAALHLHTSNPRSRGDVPEIPPVYLRKPREEGANIVQMAPPEMARAAKSDGVFELEEFNVESQPEFSRGATAFSVKLPHPVQIPERTGSHQVTIAQEVMEGDFWSETAPVVATEAFLQAKVENPFEFPILPGRSEVFVNELRTGEGRLEQVNPDEGITLGLGHNPNIVVERKDLDVSAGDEGLFEKSRVYDRHYRTIVKNQMPGAHKVVIKDRIPVSRDDKIEIEQELPAHADSDEETGVFKVTQTLEAGETAEIDTRFKVKAPRDWQLPEQF